MNVSLTYKKSLKALIPTVGIVSGALVAQAGLTLCNTATQGFMRVSLTQDNSDKGISYAA